MKTPNRKILTQWLQMQWAATWPLWVMLGIWCVFWWPVIQGAQQFYIRDLTFYTLPMKTYMLERLQSGQFPWWTPHISTGMPFFAEPTHQVLYPLNFLFWITPTVVQGISWFVLLHLLLAQWGFYALCRSLDFNQKLSLLGGLLFGYAGYTLSISDNANYLPAIVWCPLALATFIRGLKTGQPKESTLTALSITCMLFAGDTFNPVFLGVFCGLMVLLRWKIKSFQAWLSGSSFQWSFVHLALSFGLAGLLAAVQLLPTQELLALSVRQAPLELKEISLWSFPPERIVELIQPYFYGSKYPAPHFIGQFMYPQFREPWASSIYIGMIPVLLAALALLLQFWRNVYWLIMAITALLISFGLRAPYFKFLLSIFPPLNYHRYQEKLLFWVTIGICVLAVSGVQVLWEHRAHLFDAFYRKVRWTQLAWIAGLILGATLLLLKIPIDLWIWPHSLENSIDWGIHFYEREPHVAQLYWHWFFLIIPIALVPWLFQKCPKETIVTLLGLAVLDLLCVHWQQTPTAPTQLLTQRPTPAALQLLQRDNPTKPLRILYDDKVELVERQDEPGTLERISSAYQVPTITDNHEYYWIYKFLYNENRLLFNFGTLYGMGYQNGRFEPLQQKRHKLMDEILLQNQPALLPALSGIDYILTTDSPRNESWNEQNTQFLATNDGFNLRVLKVKHTVPRAYLAPNAIYNPEPEAVFKILTREFLDHDIRQQVEIASEAPLRKKDRALTPLSSQAQVKIKTDSPELIEMVVNSPYQNEDTYLVLTESLFPGWKVWVDNRLEKLYLANQRFMAVRVTPGQHQISFRYHSTQFLPGLLLSILGLLVALASFFWPGRRTV